MFRFATERPVAVFMITAAVAFFGLLSYRRLGMELMPDLAYPTLTIRTEYPGSAPEEVEAEITRDLESRVGTVEALVGMHSSSRAGRSEVVLEFDWDTDMDRAAQRVRERLARLELPGAAERPVLLRYDPALVPVMSLAVSGDGPLTTLRAYAQDELAPELSKLEGVAAVRVLGGEEREVQVRLRDAAIAARGLSVADVANRLRAANVNIAGGTVKEGEVEFLVRTLAELRTPEALGQVVVLERGGVLVRLADLADIVPTTRERTAVVRVGGREAVRVDVFRQAGANIVEVCDRVRTAVFGTAAQVAWMAREAEGGRRTEAEARRAAGERKKMTDFIAFRRPQGSSLAVLGDQSVFIRAALDEVEGAALVGGVLAILLLYLFLRSGYSTLVIAVAIPLSIAVTFVPLMLFGVSLNVMSLGGLALGVGMLVDNSVVVLESIFRCREEGDGVKEAAVRGTREVGGAVVASTLTTVAVFFPIVFVDGVAGQVFGDLALAVVCSLLASLLVAVFVVPMMASRTFAVRAVDPEAPRRWWVPLGAAGWWWGLRARRLGPVRMLLAAPYALLRLVLELLGNALVLAVALVALPLLKIGRVLLAALRLALAPLVALANRAVTALQAAYGPVLRAALRAPLVVLLVLAGAGAAAWWAARDLGAELIPEVRQGVLTADLRFPVGTPLPETTARTAVFEAQLAALPGVTRVEAFVGEPEAGEEEGNERGPHTASLTLRLTAEPDEPTLMEAIRAAARGIPGAELELGRPALFSLRPPIRVVVLGHHLGALAHVAEQVHAALLEVPGLSDVRTSVRPGYPELHVAYDRPKLAALGLTPRQVAEDLRGQVQGDVATELRGLAAQGSAAQRMDVRVRLDPDRVDSREKLGAVVINPGQPVPLPLEAVAELMPGEGPAEVRRVDGQRAAVLTARAQGFDLGTTADSIRARLAEVPLPPGFDVRLQGQDEEMRTSLESLRFALLLAVFLVYVVMASQFESLRAPLVVMGALPLAAIGVLLALGLLGTPLSVVVFVGLITLAGIVVNNAIVLVDYAQQLQARGLALADALVEAGRTRLRPILMTTLTTVLGLVPLAIGTGEGAELRQPIAVTLIAGLTFATGLTLVVIPVLYRWVVGAGSAGSPGR